MKETEFIERNKIALLQEMGASLNALQSLIEESISSDLDLSALKNILTGISFHSGVVIAHFNQLYTFTTGDFQEESEIGFKSMIAEKE